MIALFGGMAGFLTSFVPEFFNYFKDKKDKAHELELIKLQIEASKNSDFNKLEEVKLQTDAIETRALYHHAKPTGIAWVDALAGLVRPIITYSIFFLYVAIKISAILKSGLNPMSIWSDEDEALFSAIVGFWFGARSFGKMRNGN